LSGDVQTLIMSLSIVALIVTTHFAIRVSEAVRMTIENGL
jgi:hypothetical protein